MRADLQGPRQKPKHKHPQTALQALHASAQDTEAKLVDVRRRIDEVDKEVKAFSQKGQRKRAKVALRRKKVLEKQATSVQNVCHCHLFQCSFVRVQ